MTAKFELTYKDKPAILQRRLELEKKKIELQIAAQHNAGQDLQEDREASQLEFQRDRDEN